MAASNLNVLSLDASSTPITTAYVTFAAATPIPCTTMSIWNGTSSIIRIGTGVSGSEIGLVAVGPSQTVTFNVGLNVVPKGTRLAIEAVDTGTTTKFVTVTLLP